MLYIAGITIAFFLSLLLLGKPNKTLADRILAAWLILIGLHLFLFYTFITGRIYNYPWLLGTNFPMPLMHGPFLFLYASALTGKFYRFSFRQALHFIPALLTILYLLRFFALPSSDKIYVFQHRGEGYEIFQSVNIIAIAVSGVTYVLLTVMLHAKHKKKILDEFSDTERINLDWIQYLSYGIGLIWFFVLLNMDNYVFGSAVFFVLFIGYFGIKQVGIFTLNGRPIAAGTGNQVSILVNDPGPGSEEKSQVASEKNEGLSSATIDNIFPPGEVHDDQSGIIHSNFEVQKEEKKKYLKSGLSPEAAIELHNRLTELMISEKVFNRSELTLTELAKTLGTHPNYLSQVINEKEEKNFYDYINSLRTEEFKKLIADPRNQKFTLLSLAYECGFNSKSSFNKYFKKMTGQSPSEYAQSLRAMEAA